MKFFKTYLFIFIIGILFFGCKKYPENKLWFKNPEKVFKGGKITSFTMNGVDRMSYYRNLYKNFPYNLYGKQIEDVFEIPFEYSSGDKEIKTEYGEGGFSFSETKREIEITFKPVNFESGAESIFVDRLSWKIMKLTKDGVLKIQAKHEFKLYEIQFN